MQPSEGILVARGKRSAPAGAARSVAGVDSVPLGVVPPPFVGALPFVPHGALPRATMCVVIWGILVARGKRSAPAGAARSGAGVNAVAHPGVVPPPFVGALPLVPHGALPRATMSAAI
ncbi:hypothetical protein [Halomonas sp. AOP43-D1-4]|uniref:hypothetical protein n=1 Tax=Halomonas sp. AOP43-D1-4 TaxID=3457658 RepID=UPI004033391A